MSTSGERKGRVFLYSSLSITYTTKLLGLCNFRQPCVELSFYNNAKKLTKGQIGNDYIVEPSLCGDPGLEIATPMCLESGWETTSRSGKIYCNYQGERLNYAGAQEVCAAEGRELGHAWDFKEVKR